MPVLESSPEVLLQISNEQMVKDNEVDEVNGQPGSIRNIWKKFELIPTPPLSPRRCTPTSGDASPACLTDVTPASAAALQCLSDILDLDISRMLPGRNPEYSCPMPTLHQTNLTSKLIQDCMWGSHSYDDMMVQRRYTEDDYDTPCSSPEPSMCTLETSFSSGECVDSVDPASVFSYPLNNQEFTSGESSSEDEIDVVTIVEKPVKRKCQTICDNNNNNNSAKTLRHEPPAKRVKMSPKRTSREQTKQLVVVANRLEDPECKRNVHNVLERKRRNDLKYSFQVLRDSIPDLQGSERAPKVAILRKATDCILKLQSEQEGLLDEKSLLEKKHQSKLLKLKSLKERS